MAYGPKPNLAQLHVKAYRSAGLKIVAALHTAYHFNGYYQYVPPQADPNLKILYAQTGTANENDLWLGKIKEVVDEFAPDILRQDFDLNQVDQTHLLESLQYYYNAALGWGKDVVATYKDGYNNQGEVYDYERAGPAAITTPYWLTDDAVGRDSWCYTEGMSYYSPQAVLDAFIDRVSKGGNLLLNISPTWDGTIPQAQLTILEHDWHVSQTERNGHLQHPGVDGLRRGTDEDGGWVVHESHRRNLERCPLYEVKGREHALRHLDGLAGQQQASDDGFRHDQSLPRRKRKGVLFAPTGGAAIPLTFTQDGSGLHVTLPSTQPYTAVAYAMEISPEARHRHRRRG